MPDEVLGIFEAEFISDLINGFLPIIYLILGNFYQLILDVILSSFSGFLFN
ncbi:hypothetical protein PBAL39_16334 [Pedobacter sp. BAL39]|nr:hypothetical protein PBAL39_16334 [Pedobacter sp. BAL39]